MSNDKKSCCPDRCDLELSYEWDKSNGNLIWIKSSPIYLLNYGDTISITLNDNLIKIENITSFKIVSNKNGELELEPSAENYYICNGTIPTSWKEKDVFKVILTYGKKILLWQGLLNYGMTDNSNSYSIWEKGIIKLSSLDNGKYYPYVIKNDGEITLEWEKYIENL